MANTDKPDGEAIPKPASADDAPQIVEGEEVYQVQLGADPKLTTTVKAWAPGKPPGGKLPTQQSEAKDRQEKS